MCEKESDWSGELTACFRFALIEDVSGEIHLTASVIARQGKTTKSRNLRIAKIQSECFCIFTKLSCF